MSNCSIDFSCILQFLFNNIEINWDQMRHTVEFIYTWQALRYLHDGHTCQIYDVKNSNIWIGPHQSMLPWMFQGAPSHYTDVIISAMASQITGVSIDYSAVCSGAHQRKHQSSASLTFVGEIHRWPVNSPHKRPVTRKMFPFDDVIIKSRRSSQKYPAWFGQLCKSWISMTEKMISETTHHPP